MKTVFIEINRYIFFLFLTIHLFKIKARPEGW